MFLLYKMNGFVYLIADTINETYKIGKTKNDVNKRLKQLQTGNSSELILIDTFKTDYPYRLESILHNKFRHKQIQNEWFALDNNDVINFKKICQETNDLILLMKDNIFFAKNLK